MIVRHEIQDFFHSSPMIGDSQVMRDIKAAAAEIAGEHSHVLILGETGSGRETLARYIHQNSSRARHPFIPVDCASLDERHLQRELFGFTAGTLSHATTSSLGCIRAAHGGTLFLEEFDEMSLTLQQKFLTVLQTGCSTPLGGRLDYPADVRVISSTSRPSETLSQSATIDPELLAALNQVQLILAPLRERTEDVLLLAQHFLRRQSRLYRERVKSIAPEIQTRLCDYLWPKNVQELSDVMEQAHMLASGSTVTSEDLPPALNRLR